MQTEGIDPRGREHARIGGPVREVANQASLGGHCVVLEHKGSALIHVALEADHLLVRSRLELAAGSGDRVGPSAAMRVVTIRALDEPFHHAMAERLLEVGALFGVAGEAQIGLRAP